ncbi:uncharacterized protein LOC117173576 [Belonocnema kinseyi]|uniref:uncharacterized protein LOC117173576 n=1 Tax=Belonocnema kinseyi TaxID=2817044 RepID=UPI00143CF91E|nr:uncharacterized protein LOC117173576 [Belonocnema kinseyi]
MTNEDPTCVVKMLQDLRSGTEAYRRSSGIPLRLSGDPPLKKSFRDEESRASPKRPRLDESANSTTSELVPKSPWEWRRFKGEIFYLPSYFKPITASRVNKCVITKSLNFIRNTFLRLKLLHKCCENQIEHDFL